MHLMALQHAILTCLHDKLSEAASIFLHSGPLILTNVLERDLSKTHVHVAFLGTKTIQTINADTHDLPLSFKAFISSKNADENLKVLEALLTLIPNNQWGLTAVMGAEKVHAKWVDTQTLQAQDITLWSISWEQTLRVNRHTEIQMQLPSELYSGYKTYFNQTPRYTKLHQESQ